MFIVDLIVGGALRTFGAMATDKVVAGVIIAFAEMLAKRTTNKVDDVFVEGWKASLKEQGLV